MNRELFSDFNKKANFNLNMRSNFADVIEAIVSLATKLGKEQVVIEGISELPPSQALENHDAKIDAIIGLCEQQKKENIIGRQR